ncbi:MAG: TIM-barrel domain-containing protein [Candidatus Helarchaeota archaeon]
MEEINIWQIAWLYLKNRLRYPFLKKKLSEFEPNLFFGYTDHPLDIQGTPILNIFNAISKLLRKKTEFVFEIILKERDRTTFVFCAKTYHLLSLKNINFETFDLLPTDKSKFVECTLQLDFLREDVYRLRLAEGTEIPENHTPMVLNNIQDPSIEVDFAEEASKYILKTSKLRLILYKSPFRIEIFDSKGDLITESGGPSKNHFPNVLDAFPLGFVKDKKNKQWFGVESFVIYPDEAIYGLGEQFGPLNKIGQTIGLWNFEGLGNTSGRSYKNVPFFISTRGYGVFINESRPITFWVGSREYCKNQIAIEGKLVDYFFFQGSLKAILDNYTDLTGKAPRLPKWSFGVWMSRITYKTQEEVLATAKKLRAMQFPCDVIHIDTGWFEQDWRCNWKFGTHNFPTPEKMFQELKALNFRVSLWQEPYVIKGTDSYKDAKKQGILAKNHGPFIFLFAFTATPIDFSNPKATAWYKDQLIPLFNLGASVIKVDFGEQIEPPMQFMKYNGRQMHNLYSLLYNQAAFEVTKEFFGEGIIWARSAYAGSQRYPVHWSGDNSSNLENILCSLRGGLSLGLSGFTYWSQDTGGFIGIPTDEAYIRWTQMSIFQSHIRFHGTGPRFREPWNYEPATQEIVRKFLTFRYQLIPYLYCESQIASSKGLPLLRPLVLEFQADPSVYNIEDQFLCGRNLLVAPILTQNRTRLLYLPSGRWYDYWTDESLEGPLWISKHCDLEQIPLYIRAGVILPLAPPVQCTAELPSDKLILKIYPSKKGVASYTLLDKEFRCSITARIKGEIVYVQIDPKPSQLEIHLPKNLKITSIKVNEEGN